MRKSKNVRSSHFFIIEQLAFRLKNIFKEKGEEKLWPSKDLLIINSFLWEISCTLLILVLIEITPYSFFSTRREKAQDHNLKVNNRISYSLGFFFFL